MKHIKLSYSIVSFLFRKFSDPNYQNGLNRGTSTLRHSEYLKKYEPCYFDIFCRESAFYYTLTQGALPQRFAYVFKIKGHHFPGEFKIQN